LTHPQTFGCPRSLAFGDRGYRYDASAYLNSNTGYTYDSARRLSPPRSIRAPVYFYRQRTRRRIRQRRLRAPTRTGQKNFPGICMLIRFDGAQSIHGRQNKPHLLSICRGCNRPVPPANPTPPAPKLLYRPHQSHLINMQSTTYQINPFTTQ
jgi:hypothetical protein